MLLARQLQKTNAGDNSTHNQAVSRQYVTRSRQCRLLLARPRKEVTTRIIHPAFCIVFCVDLQRLFTDGVFTS